MENPKPQVSADHLWAGLLNGRILILLGSLFPLAALWFIGIAVANGAHPQTAWAREGAATVLRDSAIAIVLLILSVLAIRRGLKILRLNLMELRRRARPS